MDFPTTEPQITALVRQMLAGYKIHRADFPNISWPLLNGRYLVYNNAKNLQAKAKSQFRLATEAKDNSLRNLKNVMKQSLQKSEVDVAANPEKLKLIGWAPKGTRQPAQLPTQPINLQIAAKENRVVTLKWDRPDDDQRVRNYCIERWHQNGERFSDWTIVHVSYSIQATLRNQPLGIQLEYRIRAANNAGTGPASNTVTIVL
jgi:hypothetical protein